ncbi:helical backbone metal receptor [Postechiella marina]|uniref:Helical backbone metal receptor n=1 Tax=Postechiella marina TaxID=943941 RepID=A0ABP8BYA2_9FLAO
MQVVDQINRKLYFENTPKRIISLVPSQTELLCDLGLENSIVGITKFCVHPIDIKGKTTIVGGTKQIHINRIKALNPDIILCNKEENTKDIVEACELICSTHVSDIFNIEDSLELIKQYGTIFNVENKTALLVHDILKEVISFKAFITSKPTIKVVYFIWKNPWMVAANNTFINYLLDFNKFINIYSIKNRYPEIELSEFNSNKEVELVLLSSEPFPFNTSHIKEMQLYYPNAKVITVDGEMFSWYGSRLLKAFKYFKNLRLSLQNNLPY